MGKKKPYSRIEEIKTYHASGKTVKATLVLEGGAFRGLYTAGVLDCFLDNNIFIDTAVGISAGALNGLNYMCVERGLSANCVLRNRFNPRYVGLKAYRESGSVVGFKLMFDGLTHEIGVNSNPLFDGKHNLYAGACNLKTGICEYFKIDNEELMFKAVTASASMPLVSKPVTINGDKYLDGGCETKLPIKYALNNKFKKIIFIGTRPLTYRRKLKAKETRIEEVMYHKYPKFIQALKDANKRYNLDAEFLQSIVDKKTILAICPTQRVKVSRLEKDVEKLGDLYMLGYKDASERIEEIKEYLGI